MKIHEITKREFEKKLKKKSIAEFRNCRFPSDFKYDLIWFRGERIILDNVEVHGLTFRNSISNFSLEIINSKEIHRLKLKNCQSIQELDLKECHFYSGLRIENCGIKNFKFSKSHVSYQPLSFTNCKIDEWVDLYKIELENGIEINDCSSIGGIKLISCISKNRGLLIRNSTILNYSIFRLLTEFVSISLINSVFEGKFESRRIKVKREFNIIQCEFKKSFVFSHQKNKSNSKEDLNIIGELFVERSVFVDGFELIGNDHTNCIIKSFSIISNETLKGDIIVKNLSISKLFIKGILSNATLNLARIKVKDLFINGFDNQSNFKLRHIIPIAESTFALVNSDLGNAYLSDIDFTKFSNVIINKSTLRDINYSDISWPDKISIAIDKFLPKDSTKRNQRLHNSYRQLKQAASNNQNKIDELLFRGREWHFIQKAGVNKDQKWYWRLNDWIILATNKTNSFGTNWTYPIIWLVLSNLIFFVLILIAINENISIFEFDQPLALGDLWNLCKDEFWLYLHFLNPTHNLKHFEPLLNQPEFTGFINNGWAMFFNVIMRLTTGYFIFQTISAFRKFSKK